MEVFSCKINQFHYCIWKENNYCIIEDTEAHRILPLSDNQTRWLQEAIVELLKFPADHLFRKHANIDRGRLKVSKFQANSSRILCCDYWPYSGGYSMIRVSSCENLQGWWSFCNMLLKFVEKVNYTSWFSDNSPKTSPQFPVNRPSYVEMVNSSRTTSPIKNPQDKVPCPRNTPLRAHQVSVQPSPPKHNQWLIKNHEVVKVDFENLWIIIKLFASDAWRLIRKQLETLYQSKIIINPLYDDNALISFDKIPSKDLIGKEKKWQAWGEFHIKFEKWDSVRHSRPLVLKGFGGWMKIKNLPLEGQHLFILRGATSFYTMVILSFYIQSIHVQPPYCKGNLVIQLTGCVSRKF